MSKQMDLYKKISESLNKTYGLEGPIKGVVDTDKVYWYPTKSNLAGDNIKVYELSVYSEDFFCIYNLIVFLVPESLKVYKFTDTMKLEIVKTIKHHYLIFLIRKKTIKESSKNLFYKILLYLVKGGTQRVECHLEGIMLFLNAENMESVREYDNCIKVVHKDGGIICYDDKLNVVSNEKCKGITIENDTFVNPETGEVLKRTTKLKTNTLMHLPSKNIYIFKNSIKIEFSSSVYKKEIEIKKIEKVIENDKYLFVKNRTFIKVIYFG